MRWSEFEFEFLPTLTTALTVFSAWKLTGLVVSFGSGETFCHVQTDATNPNIIGPTMLGVVKFWPLKKSRNMALLTFKRLALLICTWRHSGHVGDHEQNCLISPLGTKSRFHVNSSKHCLLYWPPTWLPYHLTANQAQQPQIMMTFFWVSIGYKSTWDNLRHFALNFKREMKLLSSHPLQAMFV